MAMLRSGSKVPGRRPVFNPQTVSGRPMWNTYTGLDYKGAAKEAREIYGGRGGGGSKNRKLDPANLCHRIKHADTVRADYENKEERARVLSLRMDRLTGLHLDMALAEWGRIIRDLIDNAQWARLKRLRDRETARGEVRVKHALRFANIKL